MVARKKPKKTTPKSKKTIKKACPVKKQPLKMPQEATKPSQPISPRTGKPKQKQLGKSKAQVKLRAKKIAAELIQGKTAKEALLAAGYSLNSANNPAGILENPLIKKTYCEILDEAGAGYKETAKVVADGLKAMKVISAIIIGKSADEKTNDFIEVEDHPTRLRAASEIHRVRGLYQDKVKHEGDVTITMVSVVEREENADDNG